MAIFCGGGKSNQRLADVYMKRANLKQEDLCPKKVSGQTVLHEAVIHGNVKKVKSLIRDIGQIINSRDNDLNTPLHLAKTRVMAITLLLRGADTRLQNKWQLTAYHQAAAKGNIEILEAFYDYGKISIHLRMRPTYNTPLHEATSRLQIAAMKSLLENGAESNITNGSGLSPLHLAVEHNNIPAAELLINHGADVTFEVPNKPGTAQHVDDVKWKYPTGIQAIHIAAMRSCKEMISYLLRMGANINARGAYDLTPLHVSLMRRNFEATKALLVEGADVTAKTSIGDTALHLAVSVKNSKILKELLDYGARRQGLNQSGFTALHAASLNGWKKGVDILSSWGADTSFRSEADGYAALNLAASTGSLGAVEALLENNATVNVTTSEGRTPLHIAVEKGHSRVARALIRHGASINVNDPDTNESCLHLAARYCKLDLVNLLLLCGVHVDALSVSQETALHALAGGPSHTAKPETADLLLRHGIHVEAKDKIHRTALYIAMKQRDQPLCLMLLAHGADTHTTPRKCSPSIPALFFRGDQEWGDRFAYALISSGCNLKLLNLEMHAFTNQRKTSRGLTLAFDLVMWVYERLAVPLPLLQQCRRKIRQELKKRSEGMSLLHDIRMLPLGNSLKEYLLLSDCGINVPLEADRAAADYQWTYRDTTMKRKKTPKLKFISV